MGKDIKSVVIADGAVVSSAVDLSQCMITALRCNSAVTVDVTTSKSAAGTFKTADTSLRALVLGDDWLNVEPLESLNLLQVKLEAASAVSGDTTIEIATVSI